MSSSHADRWARCVGLVPALLLLTACAASPDAEHRGDGALAGGDCLSHPEPDGDDRGHCRHRGPALTGTADRGHAPGSCRSLGRGLGPRSPDVPRGSRPLRRDVRLPAAQATSTPSVGCPPGARSPSRCRPGSVRPDGAGYLAVVNSDTQIAGFDALPVAGRRLFRFTPDPARPGELLVAGGDPESGEEWKAGDFLEPWEIAARCVLRRSHGVLGVFDEGSAPVADSVMRSAEGGARRRGHRRALRLVPDRGGLRPDHPELPLRSRRRARRRPAGAGRRVVPGAQR